MAQVLPVALAATPDAGQLLLRAPRLRVQLCDLRPRQPQLVRRRQGVAGGDGRRAPGILDRRQAAGVRRQMSTGLLPVACHLSPVDGDGRVAPGLLYIVRLGYIV